ncbi:MAG: hypothetical protein JXQ73_20445 [Phycisphaerae bacterium]|nr:hypothetical protein [Phycisphaerae bacterium]
MAEPIDKAFISFRIGVPLWRSDECFDNLVRLFEKNKGVTDEITFFTSESHPPLPLAEIQARAKILTQRMAALRKLGYRSGINILATIGHHNENLANSLAEPYTRMTDIDGRTCQGSFCPNDDGLRDYAKRVYEALASANPDYIWIDDDVRLFGHMPIRCGCFCDHCLAIFEKETGVRYTRASLADAFNTGPVPKKLEVRRAWLRHNRDTINRLFQLIEQTVHAVKPDMPLGFMTGDRFFEGYDFDRWAETLAGPRKTEVMWRPGGGAYTDSWLDAIAQKAHQVGRQTAFLPESVRSIQSELESFPYQRLKKSAHATALEACSYIAGGCTGTAFNVLSQYGEPLDEFEPLVARLRQARPFLDRLARAFGRTRPVGLYSGWNKDSFAAKNVDGGDWLGGGVPGTHEIDEILVTGVPAAYSLRNAPVTALTGEAVFAFDEADLRKILASGVYMDPQALQRLNAMKLGELTGFDVENVMHDDCIEQFVGHPLNASFSGRYRNGRQSFWKCPAYALKRTNPKAEALSRIVDYTYKQVAPCCVGVFENSLGGRVCVAGYYPWEQVQNLSKSAQIKSVMRWLSKDRLPAYVASFHRANLWARPTGQGRWAIALTNAYLDPAEGLTLAVLTDQPELSVVDMQCRQAKVRATAAAGPYKTFTLPTIPPWEMRLVTV